MTDESDRQNLIQETIKLNEKLQASNTESQSQLPSTENQDLESLSNRSCLPMTTSISNTSNNKTKPYSSYVHQFFLEDDGNDSQDVAEKRIGG